MKQKYSAWFLTGLLLAALPSVAAQAEISELLRGLPSKYCSAEDGRRPVVKSQGGYGTCWALAATSALEASLLPKTHVIFSADHMALNNAFSVTLNDGGDYRMAMAYLAGWQGPVPEEADAYGDAYSPAGLLPVVHVQEMRLYEDVPREKLKKAIQTYGAVQTSLYMSRATTAEDQPYYNAYFSAYEYPTAEDPSHDVILVGWDDTVSRFLFRDVPEEDGAWVCQNSWGGSFGDDGLFYVSYADATIAGQAIAYTRIESTDNYDRIYQTDPCGWQGSLGYGKEMCWFANRYEAEEAELLAAVGFYATGTDTTYEIYFQPDGSNGREKRTLLQAGSVQEAGYYTVDLEKAIALSKGEAFYVMVKIRTPGSRFPVAAEYHSDAHTATVTTDGKYGYLSSDGESWIHTEKTFGANICLKAYTSTAYKN